MIGERPATDAQLTAQEVNKMTEPVAELTVGGEILAEFARICLNIAAVWDDDIVCIWMGRSTARIDGDLPRVPRPFKVHEYLEDDRPLHVGDRVTLTVLNDHPFATATVAKTERARTSDTFGNKVADDPAWLVTFTALVPIRRYWRDVVSTLSEA